MIQPSDRLMWLTHQGSETYKSPAWILPWYIPWKCRFLWFGTYSCRAQVASPAGAHGVCQHQWWPLRFMCLTENRSTQLDVGSVKGTGLSFVLSPAGMLSPALHDHRKYCWGMGVSTTAITGKPCVNISPAPLQADASILPPRVLIVSAFKYQ